MANTSTRAKKSPATKPIDADEKQIVETEVVEDVSAKKDKPIIPKNVDLSQFVTVVNGFQGKLIYKSSRTGERFVWEEFGDEQEMELRELRNARTAHKAYFSNNWFMFGDDDSWVIDYLGVGKFYKNALSIDDFDGIFTKSPEQIKKIVSALSPGQKKSVAYRAMEMIADEEIDSRKTISALEESLGIDLIEK